MANILPIRTEFDDGFDALEALQNLPLVMFVVDGEGDVVFVNVAAENVFLSSSRTLIANGLSHIFSENLSIKQHITQVISEQTSITLHQVEIEIKPKEKMLAEVKLTSFSANNSNKPFVIISIEMAENDCATPTNNVQNVASLADMLAHEVKNPLSGIRGAAQLLEQNADEQDKKLTQIICRECDRIHSLVESMEHFSNEPELVFEGANIHHVLDHVLSVSKAGFASDINIQTIYDPSLPLVRANQDALVQVLLNLVKNAAESILLAEKGGRGEIIVKTSYHHGGIATRKQLLSPNLAPIEITIQDNGTGIPQELLSTLFEPFVTRKKVGKGLGLALVQKMLQLHKATILAENNSVGAQFKLYLPLYTPENGEDNG